MDDPIVSIENTRFEVDQNPALEDVARQIAERTAPFGQQFVPVIGDPKMPVKRLVLNVGAWGSHAKFMVDARDNHGAQAAVATEICWWRDASWALDTGFGLLQINHGVSECATIESLYRYLKEQFKEIDFTFFTEAAPYWMAGPQGPAARHEATSSWHTYSSP